MLILWLSIFIGTIVLGRVTNTLNKELIRHAECSDYTIKKRMIYQIIAQGIISLIILAASFVGLATEILKLN